MRVQLSLLGIVIALAACHRMEQARDKAFYTANPKERAKTLASCRNEPARAGRDPDCGNALQADSEAEQQRVFHNHRDQPPGVANASHI